MNATIANKNSRRIPVEDFDPRADAADNHAEEIAEREEELAQAIADGDDHTAEIQRRQLAALRAPVPAEEPHAITILELAKFRLAKLDRATEQLNGQDFADVQLQIMGGCADCGASLAAYNAYPSRSGFWKCADDIGDDGWLDVAKADAEIRAMEAIV